MECLQCRHDNPGGQKFCGECGAPLMVACGSCRASNPPANKFCGECGAKLTTTAAPRASTPAGDEGSVATPAPVSDTRSERFGAPESYTPKHLAEKILTSKSAVVGERKQVTVMFTDVSGFTAMSERLDPEDVHAIMDRAFAIILDAVHRYEGTINQFLGDGVMALFGAPIAHEDHAQRALGAALAIQDGLRPLADEVRRVHHVEFRMRIGINTGPVVVGAIGKDLRMDYTAVGDTTNLAARLLAVAQPGQIVVSRRTQHLRERVFAFEDLGEFQVKGKSEPVRAYALVGESADRAWLEVSKERALTPLVGRAREIERLRAAWGRARSGDGAIVSVAGEPGVGKSRLIYEFVRELDAMGVQALEATCASYGRSMAFRPVVELLRRYFGLLENASADDIRGAVADRLDDLELEGGERAVLLAHLLGAPASAEFLNRLSAPQLKDRTFAALCDVLLHASRVAPFVVVIENVHWIDASSAELITRVADAMVGHRLLVVLSTRPGFVPWLTLPTIETISLEGLDASDVDRMVRTLVGAERASDDLLAFLAARGEGNPLYVEEILDDLKETDGLVVEDGIARLGAASARVPPTIHDIIAARIDRLAEPLKLTLQAAGVAGRRFGVSLVSRIIDVPHDDVARHLTELHALGFVFPAATDPELMYSFKHALTQDVVYLGLLERRRRLYHAAAGRGLEDLYANRVDEVVELLAYHFGASSEDEKAVDYALLAAEKAQRRWANADALASFDAAVKRLDAMPDTTANRLRRIDAIVKQAEVKFALGRQADHVEALEGIHDLVETTADPPRRAAWHYWTGFLHTLTGARPEVPIAYCREASTIAEGAGLDDIKAFADCCLAQVCTMAGQLDDAVAAGKRALAYFEARGNVWWACRTLWALSSAAGVTGDWAQGLDYAQRALEHGQAVDDLRLKVAGWWRTASLHVQRGDAEAGLRCCEEALALSPIPFDAANISAVKGYGLIKAGKVDAGITELAGALAWLDQSHLTYFRAFYALWLAEGHLRQGERARARAILEEILTTTRGVSPRVEGIAERLLGEALVHDDPGAAAVHLDAATRISERIGARNELAKILVARAQLRRADGDLAGARQLLEDAHAMFERLGTLDEPALARAAIVAA